MRCEALWVEKIYRRLSLADPGLRQEGKMYSGCELRERGESGV